MSMTNEEIKQKGLEIVANATKKPSKIAGSFVEIEDLEEKHIKHFKNAPYLFKALSGNIYGGVLVDDSLEYIHLVLVSPKVLEYIFSLRETKIDIENEEIFLAN